MKWILVADVWYIGEALLIDNVEISKVLMLEWVTQFMLSLPGKGWGRKPLTPHD